MDKVKRYHFHLLALSLAGYFVGTGIHGVAGGSAGPVRTMAGLLGGAILAFILSIVMHGRNKDLRPAMKVQEGDERIQRIRGLSARISVYAGQIGSFLLWLYGVWQDDLTLSMSGAILFLVLTGTDYLSRQYYDCKL